MLLARAHLFAVDVRARSRAPRAQSYWNSCSTNTHAHPSSECTTPYTRCLLLHGGALFADKQPYEPGPDDPTTTTHPEPRATRPSSSYRFGVCRVASMRGGARLRALARVTCAFHFWTMALILGPEYRTAAR